MKKILATLAVTATLLAVTAAPAHADGRLHRDGRLNAAAVSTTGPSLSPWGDKGCTFMNWLLGSCGRNV